MAEASLRAVILDADSLGADIDLTALQLPGLVWDIYPSTQAEETLARIQNAAIVISNKVVIDAAMMAQASDLRLINVAATGTNNIALEAAAANNITVCNCVNYGSSSVAQHVLMLMLVLATRFKEYQQAVQDGRWQQSPFFCLLDYPIAELRGATLGIIGYGDLGRAVIRLAEAFEMRVLIGQRPGSSTCPPDRVPLPELYAQADFISLHCPLTAATQNLIAAKELQAMKKSAYLINCARGGIVNEATLLQALQQEEIAGAALDVLSEEPPQDNPLLADTLPNLLITPHIAWASQQARQTVVAQLAENIAAFLEGKPIRQVLA